MRGFFLLSLSIQYTYLSGLFDLLFVPRSTPLLYRHTSAYMGTIIMILQDWNDDLTKRKIDSKCLKQLF